MTAFVGFAVQVRTERGEREEGWERSEEVRQGQRGAAGTGRQRRQVVVQARCSGCGWDVSSHPACGQGC